MAATELQRLVILSTHGPDDPERATVPFVLANAGLAMEARVTVVLQSDGGCCATCGRYEEIREDGFGPPAKLVPSFLELGGTLLVCFPCIERRRIPPAQLVAGVQLVMVGRVAAEMLDADAVASY